MKLKEIKYVLFSMSLELIRLFNLYSFWSVTLQYMILVSILG